MRVRSCGLLKKRIPRGKQVITGGITDREVTVFIGVLPSFCSQGSDIVMASEREYRSVK
jgi:hypothetical protein